MTYADEERDVSTIADLDPTGGWSTTGKNAVAQALARRLQTPRGSLFYDPDFGFDVRTYLNEGVTDLAIVDIKSQVETECEKDERVSNVSVELDWNERTGTMILAITAESAEGPFAFTLSIDKVSAAVLRVE